jgi:aminoglycoside 6'-N-acetyltransferase
MPEQHDSLPVLRTPRLILRPLADEDVEPLLAIVTGPRVREWWGTIDDLDHEREGLRNEGQAFVVEVGGEVAGWLGFNEENEPDYRFASLDVALAPAHQDRGLGPEALRTAIDWLVADRGHHRFTIDPALANERAIAAYAKVGFRPVGVMRKYERRADGTWHDALLMDLLAEELPPPPTVG